MDPHERIASAPTRRRPLVDILVALLLVASPAVRAQSDDDPGAGPSVLFQHENGRLVRVAPRFGPRAFLGVSTVDLTPELREHLGAPRDRGVLVSSLVDGGPARHAGLRVGDIVTGVGGETVDSTLSLVHAVSGHGDGEATTVEAWRDGEKLQVEIVVEERDIPFFDVGPLVFRTREGGPARLLTVGPGELKELRIDPQRLDELGRELGERIGSGDPTRHLELRLEDREELQGRIEELERRLHELETELQTLLDDGK